MQRVFRYFYALHNQLIMGMGGPIAIQHAAIHDYLSKIAHIEDEIAYRYYFKQICMLGEMFVEIQAAELAKQRKK